MSGSVAFDRAAAYYDATRGLSEEGVERTTSALADGLAGADPVLEVGVGTGLVALPLRAAGVRVTGIDLSSPMLEELVAKDPSRPIALVQGDATAMPFPDDAFGGAYLRWVLHLIPDWEAAVREIARVVRPGGRFIAGLGAYGGIDSEIKERFADVTGISTEPVGLGWEGWARLDELMGSLGAGKLPDLAFEAVDRDDVETFMRGIEANRYSWTWPIDDAVRRRAAADVRAWAEDRWGPLDELPKQTSSLRFAAYRLS